MSNSLAKIESHLTSPQELAKFVGVLDKDAMPYIRSVMIAVEENQMLQNCTPESIGIAALRAASLKLSCDPAVKQAYMIPYWNGKKKVNEAKFQPHYLGLYTLAVRSNKYSVIEVTPFPAGYDMRFDVETGNHIVVKEDGTPVAFAPRVKEQEAQAWFGYLRTYKGFVNKVWMTKEQIHEHAQKYNAKGYNANGSLWKNPDHVHTMEKKTVLRELLNWADKSGHGDSYLHEALKDSEPEVNSEPVIEGDFTTEAAQEMTIEEARQVIIKTRDNGEKFLGELNAEQLQLVIENAKTPEHIEAAKLVLATDFQMESA